MNSLGNLSQCMMDSDPEALARRLRRKAVLISVILEALLLGATLLWPLITTGVLPPRYTLTPFHHIAEGAARRIPVNEHIEGRIGRDQLAGFRNFSSRRPARRTVRTQSRATRLTSRLVPAIRLDSTSVRLPDH
jgi:hypothetical protein